MKLNTRKTVILLALLSVTIFAQQQKRIAIINTVDDEEPPVKSSELNYLTDRLREIAIEILPQGNYAVMTQQSMVAFLGSQESMVAKCKASEGCLAKLGREINADYIGQGRIGRFSKDLSIKVELYDSKSGNLISSFTGTSKDIEGLLSVLDSKAPDLFKKMSEISAKKSSSLSFASGIGSVQIASSDYKFSDEKRYLVNIVTEPAGAVLSFNGIPDSHCTKAPCKTELAKGSVRIIANMEQYEIADTAISIEQNNQNINIRLKSNFGILGIKPAYSDSIGKNDLWNLSINGKKFSSLENKLSSGKYKVELSHKCYEALSFEAGINKDKREVFDMAGYIKLKMGGLDLSAEKNGKPTSEVVYVNGKRVGETPFSGTVPICAKIEIGEGRENIDAKLKHNEKVMHKIKIYGSVNGSYFTDSRDGRKYRFVKIGSQTWMAENLDYAGKNDDIGSCYDRKPENCEKYGALYAWDEAKKACPDGWHLPSNREWQRLVDFAGGDSIAGKKLKAKNVWKEHKCKYTTEKVSGRGQIIVTEHNKCSTDEFSFSLLPGGSADNDKFGRFYNIGDSGYWWSASGYSGDFGGLNNAYYRSINYGGEAVLLNNNKKSYMFSVRCVKD